MVAPGEDPLRPGPRSLFPRDMGAVVADEAVVLLLDLGQACNDVGLAVQDAQAQLAHAAEAQWRYRDAPGLSDEMQRVTDERFAACRDHTERLTALYASWRRHLARENAGLASDHRQLVAAMPAVESPSAAFDDPDKVAERQTGYLLEAEFPALHGYAASCAFALAMMSVPDDLSCIAEVCERQAEVASDLAKVRVTPRVDAGGSGGRCRRMLGETAALSMIRDVSAAGVDGFRLGYVTETVRSTRCRWRMRGRCGSRRWRRSGGSPR